MRCPERWGRHALYGEAETPRDELLLRRWNNPLVRADHCVSKAALLLPENQAMGRIVRWFRLLHNAKAVSADIASNDAGQIFSWIAGERVFWWASLLDHEGFDIDRHCGVFENSGRRSPRTIVQLYELIFPDTAKQPVSVRYRRIVRARVLCHATCKSKLSDEIPHPRVVCIEVFLLFVLRGGVVVVIPCRVIRWYHDLKILVLSMPFRLHAAIR